MSSFLWPSEDGWPYPDTAGETADLDAMDDDDVLCLKTGPTQLLGSLDPLERAVICGRYGLEGKSPRSMKELCVEMGMPRAELREALGNGLAKLRTELR